MTAVSRMVDHGQNGGCFVQTPLRDRRIVLGIPSDINQYPSLVSCDVLLLGTGCGPDEALKQFPVPESVHVLVLVTIPFAL